MTEFAKSRVTRACIQTCSTCQRTSLSAWLTCQRACVSASRFYVPKCQTACQFFNLGCQRARRRADFLNIPLNETREISILHYYIKKFYIILDIICICIVHRNCIILISILRSYQRKVWNFSFSFFLFCSLVRIENI